MTTIHHKDLVAMFGNMQGKIVAAQPCPACFAHGKVDILKCMLCDTVYNFPIVLNYVLPCGHKTAGYAFIGHETCNECDGTGIRLFLFDYGDELDHVAHMLTASDIKEWREANGHIPR